MSNFEASVGRFPTYDELLRLVERTDEAICEALATIDLYGPRYAKRDLEGALDDVRGGSAFCPECRHINAIGHSCADWTAYDAGELTTKDLTAKAKARRAALTSGTRGLDVIVTENLSLERLEPRP